MARLIVFALLMFAAAQAAEFTYTESSDTDSDIALGFPPPQPVDTTIAGDWFRSYDSLRARHQELMLDNATVRGEVIGETWTHEDIWLYRIGDEDGTDVHDGVQEGAVLINGGIHAREWQTQEATTGFIEHLVAIQDDDGVGSFISDNLDVFIIPVHNIDGFRQTQRYWNRVTGSVEEPRDGRMRRKNLHAPGDLVVDDLLSTTGDNLYGIDLNRNSEFGFGNTAGSSSDTTSLIYHGTKAASEPETRALQAAMDKVPAGQLRFFEDVHSFSQLLYVPQTGDSARDEYARKLATSLSVADASPYAVYPDPVGGAIGTTADYFAYRYGVPSWTLELEPRYEQAARQYGGIGVSHDGFILPESEVARLRDEYNRMHLPLLYRLAGPAYVREVHISRVDNGEPVYAAEWRSDGNARQLVVDLDGNLQPQTTYRLRVVFSKPMRVSAGAVPADAVRLVDADGEDHASFGTGQWLSLEEAAARYHFDAFSVEFESIASGSAARHMLVIDVADMANQRLDADPATVARFADGKWTRYETFPGDADDPAATGNADCNIMPSAGSGDTTAATGNTDTCRVFLGAPPLSTGGGGGSVCWFLLLVVLRSRHDACVDAERVPAGTMAMEFFPVVRRVTAAPESCPRNLPLHGETTSCRSAHRSSRSPSSYCRPVKAAVRT